MADIWGFQVDDTFSIRLGEYGALRPPNARPDWTPVEPPRAALKQIDAADAHYIERGCLKIGRLEDYAAIENGRADQADGALLLASGELDSDNPEHRATIEDLNIVNRDFRGKVTVSQSLIRQRSGPTYAFCMAKLGCDHDPSPEKAKALYEIVDIQRLGALIAYEHGGRFQSCLLSTISYEPRLLWALQRGEARPSPFIKDVVFEAEQEVRFAFTARRGAPYETIYTAPNEAIASLFKRIA